MSIDFVVDMSCSQFIEHEEEDKSDTLVIIVNGDGTVTVDPLTLERVLCKMKDELCYFVVGIRFSLVNLFVIECSSTESSSG